jgi:hypothetical protein
MQVSICQHFQINFPEESYMGRGFVESCVNADNSIYYTN